MGLLTNVRSAGMTALRKVRHAFGGTAVVLAYHRVADEPLDPLGIAVTPALFEEQVSRLADGCNLMTAGDLFAHLANRSRLPERSVVITLDDGYADAFTTALPILERHGAPATVFVTPAADGVPFWWDEAARLVLSAGELPGRISLAVGDVRLETGPGEASSVFHDVLAFLRPLSGADRTDALGQLASQIAGSVGESPQRLSPEQIVALDANGLVEIGAHTLSHEILALRSPDEQRAEIAGSRRVLEALLGHEVVSFAYPHGEAGDYSAETVRIVREVGFLGACTTRLGGLIPWGSAGLRTDRFQVPRTATVGLDADVLVALVSKRLGV